MTIFSDNPHDRRIERFMTAIPNFKPRGVGFRFTEMQAFITVTAATCSRHNGSRDHKRLNLNGGAKQ